MNDLSSKIAESLLQIKAIKLNPANHFTWASGWYSPIYCDNRKILSYPAVRKQVYEGFERIIAEKYPDADIIAGVATGAIPTAAENFAGADVKLDTLSDYKTMIELAAKQGYVHEDELQTLQQWRRDPANWKKSAQ